MPSPRSAAPPRHIGRYEVVRALGEGGQGTVVEGVLRGPGGFHRRVALKRLHDGAGLAREARLGGLLRHPNLVDVYELGEDADGWFCAMELCRDGCLADRVPLPPRAIVEVGLQVASALHYAHQELGLVHLDLKPRNLLLDGATVKVADLGIARAAGFADDGRARGSPGYMAPEQRRGGQVDARTDVYALGVTLAELASGRRGADETYLTGLPDLDGDEAEEPAAAPWLAAIVDRCCAPEPEERYPSMAALADALRELSVDGPGLADVVGPRRDDPAVAPRSDAFVGRAVEREAVRTALAEPGLVTLKGPGGIGKTRLAREVAAGWAGPVARCELAAARDADGLLRAVATGLGLALGAGGPEDHARQVGWALAGRADVLVLLDTFEHLEPHAGLVGRWLADAPGARFLATSRSPLRLAGERVIELSTLPESEAVALLADRALERGADVAGDPALTEIARRLDGVPLALELAAGRIGVLSPAEVLERLALSLLRSGRSDASDREASLAGALDWSWNLLGEPDRRALAALSVFRGAFGAEAADAVVGLDRVAPLVDGSLVVARDGRFALLSTVREHARAQLDDDGDAERRHGAWYAQLGDRRAIDALSLEGGEGRRRALALDRDELLAACERAIARGDVSVAAPTALAAWAVFELRGPFAEGLGWMERVRGMAPEPRWAGPLETQLAHALRARGRLAEAVEAARSAVALHEPTGDLVGLGRAHTCLGKVLGESRRPAEAERAFAEGLALARRTGDLLGEGSARLSLGIVLFYLGRIAEAADALRRSAAIHRELGGRRGEAVALMNLSFPERAAGRPEVARGLLEQALALFREIGDRRFEATTLHALGSLATEARRLDDARAWCEAGLRLTREVGHRWLQGGLLDDLAMIAADVGDPETAEAHCRAALATNREVGNARGEGISLLNLGAIVADAGRNDEARACFEAALACHRACGDPVCVGIGLGSLGRLEVREGRSAEAAARLGEATSALERNPRALGLFLADLGEAMAGVGDVEGARAAFERAEGITRARAAGTDLVWVLCARARGLADPGALAEAEALAAALGCAPRSPAGVDLARTRRRAAGGERG